MLTRLILYHIAVAVGLYLLCWFALSEPCPFRWSDRVLCGIIGTFCIASIIMSLNYLSFHERK